MADVLKVKVKLANGQIDTVEFPTKSSIDFVKTEVCSKTSTPKSRMANYYLLLNHEYVLSVEFKKFGDQDDVKKAIEKGDDLEISLISLQDAKELERKKKDGTFERSASFSKGAEKSVLSPSSEEEPAPKPTTTSSSSSSSSDDQRLRKLEDEQNQAQKTIKDLQDKLRAAERKASDLEEKTKSQEKRIRELEEQLKASSSSSHGGDQTRSVKEEELRKLKEEDANEEDQKKKIQDELRKLKEEEEEEERQEEQKRKDDEKRKNVDETRRKDEEKKRKEEDDKRTKDEDDKRKKEEDDKRKKEDDDKRKKEEDDKRKKEDDDKRKKEDDDKRKKEDDDKRKKDEDDKRKKEEDDKRKKDEDDKRKKEEESHKKEAEKEKPKEESKAEASVTSPRAHEASSGGQTGFRPPPASTSKLPLKIGGLTFEDRYEIKNVMESSFQASAYSGWVLVGYTNKAGNQLALTGSSDGNLESLVEHLKDDQVQYAVVRISNDSAASMSGRTKDIFISWIGPSVGTIEKGKKTAHLGDIQKVVQPFHITIHANSGRANLTLDNLHKALADGKNSV